MKLYLAGPMRGRPEYNFPAFLGIAETLREEGYEIVSPAELDLADGMGPDSPLKPHMTTKWFMQRDLPALLECDGIALMDGWEDSVGARIEYSVAELLEMDIYYVEDLLERAFAKLPPIGG